MVEIEYDRKSLTLNAKGHAGSDTYGHDLVCAGVSTLVYTLIGNLDRLHGVDYGDIEIRLEPGDSQVRFMAEKGKDSVPALIFQTICVGFEMLEQQFPEFVRYTVVG